MQNVIEYVASGLVLDYLRAVFATGDLCVIAVGCFSILVLAVSYYVGKFLWWVTKDLRKDALDDILAWIHPRYLSEDGLQHRLHCPCVKTSTGLRACGPNLGRPCPICQP